MTQPTQPSTSASSSPIIPDAALTTSSPPQTQGSDSLYAIGIQAEDIAGEIALASELLESDDPEERQAAIDLVEHFLAAEEHTHSLLMEKSEKIVHYIETLRAQSALRKQRAKDLNALADADERRANKLFDYMTNVLTRINPTKTKFSLPYHELTSRAVNDRVEIIDDELIPDDLMAETVKVTRRPDKDAIKQAIREGRNVVGAKLVSYRSWSIK